MEKREIEIAINNARAGIQLYLEIMELFPHVDVSQNGEFQRKFNSFYRIRQRPSWWYATYYSFMELGKNQRPSFDHALEYFHQSMSRCEASFTSKLIATLDPLQPVWDQYVLRNTGIPRPKYTSKKKIEETKRAYRQLESWYADFQASSQGQLIIALFNKMVEQSATVTDLKKIDFVLWQMRAQ